MSEQLFYAGSFGPYMYDDADTYDDGKSVVGFRGAATDINGDPYITASLVLAYGTATLAAGATSTTITVPKIAASSVVMLTATTANAAGALATTYVKPADIVVNTSFKLTHANTATTDRTFFFVVLGTSS